MALDLTYDPNWKPSGGLDLSYDPNWKPKDPGIIDQIKQGLSSTPKRQTLDSIVSGSRDEVRAMQDGIDAGYRYQDVDSAISNQAQRKAAMNEKRTAANVAADVAAQPLLGAQKMAGGAIQAVGDFISPDPDKPIDAQREQGGIGNIRQIIGKGLSQFGSEIHGEGEGVEKQLNVEMPNSTAQGLYGGVKSLSNQAPALISPFGTAATLGYMGGQVGLDKYAEARKGGYSPGESGLVGAGHGGIEVLTEALPTKFFKENAGKAGFGDFLKGIMLREVPGEQVATLGQDAIDQATGLSGKTKGDWQQYKDDRWDAAYQTFLATVAQSGIQAAGSAAYKTLTEKPAAQKDEPVTQSAPTETDGQPGFPAPVQPAAPQLPDTGPLSRSANVALATQAAAIPAVSDSLEVSPASGADNFDPQDQRLAELELLASQRPLTAEEATESNGLQAEIEQREASPAEIPMQNGLALTGNESRAVDDVAGGNPAQPVVADQPGSADPAMAAKTDWQLKNLSGPGHSKSTRQAAASEIARRAAMVTEGEASAAQPSPAAEQISSVNGVNAAPAADLSGEKLTKEWASFADGSGSLNIPRAEMPQIKAEHRGALTQFMNARGIEHQQGEVAADSLKPTQAEFSPAKVKKAIGFDGGDRSILISSDNHILDGHHQWLAKREQGKPISVIRFDAPIADLIKLSHDFPSSKTSTGATPQPAKKPTGPANRDDILGAILRVTGGKGISSSMSQTIVGDKANQAKKVRGLFQNQGTMDLDDTADLLRTQEGYDVRDGNHLSELIRQQADGNPVYSMERTEREATVGVERVYRDHIRRSAKKLGIKAVARPFGAIEEEVLRRLEQRHADAVSKLDARAKSRFDAMLKHAMAIAEFDEIDAIVSDAENRFFGRQFWAEATKQLRGYIDDLTAERLAQEQNNEASTETGEPDWLGTGPEGTGGRIAADRVDQAPPARSGQEAEQEAGFLTQQTNEQAAEQFAQQQAGEPNAPAKERADRERDAVPFSLQQDSQAKPQGVQTGLFTADGRVSAEARPADYEPRTTSKSAPVAELDTEKYAESNFVKAPNGSIDFGEITQEMAKVMRRQPGKIRLEPGDSSYGLQHIEERHGRQIRGLGFDSVEAFVADAVGHIASIWKPRKTSQMVLIQSAGKGKAVYIELKPAESGDFYTVNTAFAVGKHYAENKGWGLLWSGASVPTVASGANPLAESSPNAGMTTTMTPGQSSDSSVALTTPEGNQGTGGGAVQEESDVYTVNEPDGITGDLFQGTDDALPAAKRKNTHRQKAVKDIDGAGSRPVLAIREAPDTEGVYYVRSQLVTVGERKLPVAVVNSPEDAARAFAGLSRFAVEHMDGLVTDKAGKPLAIIGGFKGAPTQAQAYPSTIMMELSRIDGAANLWLSHNHPSGNAQLSRADENLSGMFGKILKGSSITYRGLSAMARNGNEVSWSDSEYNNGVVPANEPAAHTIPIVERELVESSPGATINSPAAAKNLVSDIAKDKPGVVFVTAQNQVASFVPFDPDEMGQLRSGDRLMRLFRAAAKSGGTGAFVAMPDGRVLASEFANIKGALEQIDVRVLDGIEYSSDGTGVKKSLAERGLDASMGAAFLARAEYGDGIQMEDLNAVASGFRTEFPGIPVMTVEDENQLPKDLRDEIAAADAIGDVAGAYHQGQIYLIKNGIRDIDHAQHTVIHEGVHGGLKRIGVPDEALLDIAKSNPKIRDEAYRIQAKYHYAYVRSVEEAMADQGRAARSLKGWARLQAWARGKLRKMGVVNEWSDTDVDYLLTKALTSLKTPASTTFYRGTAFAPAWHGSPHDSITEKFNRASGGKITPADKAIYGMAAEGKSAAEILKFIASASRSPFNRQVAKVLIKTGIAPSITVGDAKGWKFNAGEGKYAAAYNPKTDTAVLFRPASAERNMVHELIHAATLKALTKNGIHTQNMKALYAFVKRSGKLKGMYGMTDVDEFVAESFSNPKFQNALKGIDVPRLTGSKTKNAWSWFIRNVRSILGMKVDSHDALSQALDIGLGVMRENMRLSGDAGGGVRHNVISSQWSAGKSKLAELTSPESISALVYNFQNKYVDLKNLQDRIKQIGGTLTDLNDAYLGEEMYHGKVMKKTADFLDDELRPMLQQLFNNGIKKEDFESFLHARHAPEANRALAERNPTQAMIDAGKQAAENDLKVLRVQLQKAQAQNSATKSIEQAIEKAQAEKAKWSGAQAFQGTEEERLSLSGMSDAEASRVIASIPAGKRQAMNSAAEKVDAIQAKTLAELEKYGLMDKASLDAWRKEYQHYIPLHRDEAHPDSTSHPIGQGFSVKGDAAKRRTGSNEKVTNILGHIAMQREAAITRGEKNSVSKRLWLQASQNPDKDFWVVDRPPMLKTIDQRTGFVRSQVDPTYKNKPNVLMVRIAGRDAAIVFNEHNPEAVRLAEALKNLDGQDLDVVERTIGKVTRWFSAVNTQYNPVFGIINLLRDGQSGILNLTSTALGDKKWPVSKHIPAAIKAIYQMERGKQASNQVMGALWSEFQNVGGQTGYRDLYASPDDRVKALDKELKSLERGNLSKRLHAVADWLSDYNTVMENGVRLAAYKVAIDQGMSKERAASLAKNLTVNFNRKGAKAAKLGSFYAFFNASVQGTERLAKTMSGPAGRKILIGGIALGVLQQVLGALFMAGDDGDDEWDKIPDFVKERSLIIPIGGGQFVSIPMPLGFNVLPNIGRLFTEWAMGGKDKPTGKQIGKLMNIVIGSFNPLGGSDAIDTLSPTVSDPVIAMLRNKDWTGKPIYREDMSGLDPTPGFTRTKDSATPWSKGISYVVNWASGGTDYQPGAWSPTPDQIDYVIGQVTGGVGREIGKVAQTAAAPFSGDELPVHKVPLLGRLVGSTNGPSGQSEKFYENIRELNGIEREIKGRIKNGKDIDSYMDSEPKTSLVGAGNAAEGSVRKLREQRRMLTKEGDLSGAKEMDGMISVIMKGLNAEMKNASK